MSEDQSQVNAKMTAQLVSDLGRQALLAADARIAQGAQFRDQVTPAAWDRFVAECTVAALLSMELIRVTPEEDLPPYVALAIDPHLMPTLPQPPVWSCGA